jgi:hypothetical protein
MSFVYGLLIGGLVVRFILAEVANSRLRGELDLARAVQQVTEERYDILVEGLRAYSLTGNPEDLDQAMKDLK